MAAGLESKVVVVTGGSSGIGRAVAELGRLDGAFDNAGGVPSTGLVPQLDDTAWRAWSG